MTGLSAKLHEGLNMKQVSTLLVVSGHRYITLSLCIHKQTEKVRKKHEQIIRVLYY